MASRSLQPSGLAIGLSLGVALGVATGNLGLWIALGVVLGLTLFSQGSGDDANRAEDDEEPGSEDPS